MTLFKMKVELMRLQDELQKVQERKKESGLSESTYLALVKTSNELHRDIRDMQQKIHDAEQAKLSNSLNQSLEL